MNDWKVLPVSVNSDLEEQLQTLEREGWQIFQILGQGDGHVVVARKLHGITAYYSSGEPKEKGTGGA